MQCPRCTVTLEAVAPDEQTPEVQGLGCHRCGGVWLEQADLSRLEQVVDVTWLELRHVPPPALQAELLTCPRCAPARHLGKAQSERDRQVVLDVCAHCHGVWLDGGELEAIQRKGLVAAVIDAVRFLMTGR
jgi:Zn-finger nucleic acid-binding protein